MNHQEVLATLCRSAGYIRPCIVYSWLHVDGTSNISVLASSKWIMATPEEEFSSIQDKEILRIKSRYPGQVEVKSCIGEIHNIVMLSFEDLGLQLKFQLTDEYPNSAASVSVRSTTLSHDQQEVLTNHLQEEAHLKRGQQMMQHLAVTALKWLEYNKADIVHREAYTKNEEKKGMRIEKKSKHGNGMEDITVNDSSSTPRKWSAMKTRAELIYRREDDYRIREELTGAVGEQRSEAYQMESLSLYDVVKPKENLSIENSMHFEVNHDRNYCIRAGDRNTRKYPNFFLSLDITNTTVIELATEVQKKLSYYLPNYANYTEPESSLHITLALMNLKDKAEISNCSKILKNMEPNLADLARKVPPLNLRGVGNFGEGTIFARVQRSPRFFDFVNVLTESLQNGGVNIIKQNEIYTPHLTLVKCPKGMRGKASPETVAQCIHRLQDVNFGTQMLDSVHLYKMGRVNDRYRETAVITFY